MADTKISAGADPGTLVATDKVPMARSASTTAYAATMAELATFANTAYVPNYSSATPAMDGAGVPGVAATVSRGDHIHPSDTSRVKLGGDTMTGALALATGSTAPTPTTGDSSTKLATTAFVQAQMVASGAGVSTWNTRAGAVVLQQSDITAVGALHDVGRNRLHNSAFRINQRGYTSGTALAAGAYGHDRWKAGAGGCTYTFTQNQPATTITITAGSLQQIIEALDVEGGTYTLSWTGTAQGRVGAGSYAASPVTATGLAANTAITVEFNAGTLGTVQWESGNATTPYERQSMRFDLGNCQRFYQVGQINLSGYATAGISCHSGLLFPTPMRASPTMTPTYTTQTNCGSSTVLGAGTNASGFAPYTVVSATGGYILAGTFTASVDL